MSEPALKCEKYAIFKQNYTQELFISFKISYSRCFGFRGNLEFPDFLKKKFYNIDYWCPEFRNFKPVFSSLYIIISVLPGYNIYSMCHIQTM